MARLMARISSAILDDSMDRAASSARVGAGPFQGPTKRACSKNEPRDAISHSSPARRSLAEGMVVRVVFSNDDIKEGLDEGGGGGGADVVGLELGKVEGAGAL